MNKSLEQIDKIEAIVATKCGEGKRFANIGELLQWCKDTVDALGPAAMIAGGAFGIKFYILIPILEETTDD